MKKTLKLLYDRLEAQSSSGSYDTASRLDPEPQPTTPSEPPPEPSHIAQTRKRARDELAQLQGLIDMWEEDRRERDLALDKVQADGNEPLSRMKWAYLKEAEARLNGK